MHKILIISFFCIPLLLNCSSTNTKSKKELSDNIREPEDIYIMAMQLFESKQYELADEEFRELQQLYPLSNEAIQAEIMSGFISYLTLEYDSSIYKFKKVIQKYPSHKELDYVYYMVAMCNYEQITSHELDGEFNQLAIEAFDQVILRFPDSEYAKDSRQKIILVKSNKAAKHMEIGRFYLKDKKYTAALNRFKVVIEDYSMTKFTPEALHRMVEAYFEMGMMEESIKTASVLGHNYPESKWYKYSYNLIKEIEDNKSIFNKFTKFFD